MKILAYSILLKLFPIYFLSLVSAQAALVAENPNPRHPYMAVSDNNMHVDSYVTDVHPGPGPLGFSAEVKTFDYGKIAGECAGILFDRKGDILTVCVKLLKTQLLLINRDSLEIKASFSLPRRPNILLAAATFQFEKIMEDTSGGAYFFIDEKDRAVVATSEREILVIGQKVHNGKTSLELVEKIDLKQSVPSTHCPTLLKPNFSDPRCDKVTTVLSDFNGNYWFISRYGKVGVVDRYLRQVKVTQLPNNEQLQNSFAIGDDGVFIVSDHALYKFDYHPSRGPFVIWRESYDRGIARKLGQINQGSGTSPSLMGDKYVAIADNAWPRMNILVYRRGKLQANQKRLVCKVPVFKKGFSATENSFVVFNNTIIVENNYGYQGPFANNSSAGGVARIDISEDGKSCHQVWQSDIIAPTSVPKLSLESEIVYFYTKDQNNDRKKVRWSLTGLDFHTGEVVTRIFTGVGNKFNNNWGAISLGPDGEAFIGSLKGFIKVK